ncbi:unnamed protein product, partial [Musa acuminata subsp. burmannicoides]
SESELNRTNSSLNRFKSDEECSLTCVVDHPCTTAGILAASCHCDRLGVKWLRHILSRGRNARRQGTIEKGEEQSGHLLPRSLAGMTHCLPSLLYKWSFKEQWRKGRREEGRGKRR